ncbi:hypothetical protein SAY86_000673 [Trapa natans]|uniref:Pentatricopeptide repeat-containing protein n=1 Tax=Trapa natans TaxID=22666 RepID=A0AAN7MAQ3_TRANT|nr:hypothetical protein SAY86_000673 [Trapa natans]
MVSSLSKSRSSRTLPCIARSFLQLCYEGRLSEALSSLPILSDKGIRLPTRILAVLISRCVTLKQARWVHLHLKLTGLKKPNALLSNHLIRAYFRCGSEFHARKMFDEMPVRSLYSWNNLISGYAKVGRMGPARKLFDKMPERDTVSWNTMLMGYAKCGDCGQALRFYKEFRKSGLMLSKFSLAGILAVCVKLRELRLTRQVHVQVLLAGYSLNMVLLSSLLDAYTKCGEMADARNVFDEMKARDVLTWTTLISGYARWGDMDRASEVFYEMPVKNPVSWTALIAGYVRNGLVSKALELFTKMMAHGIPPEQFTLSSCLCACASMSKLKHGKQIHAHMIRTNYRANPIVLSSLIDMYSKCGNLDYARMAFDLLHNNKEIILWNTMMSALVQHGLGRNVIEMYHSMLELGMKPDRITFVVLLSACSHSCLLEEGVRLFESMIRNHRVSPDQEHYMYFIDLLDKAGHFAEVLNQLRTITVKSNDRAWDSFLFGISKIHGHVMIGQRAAELLTELQPNSSAAWEFLSSVYAALGRWDSVAEVRKLINNRLFRKEQATSWSESGSKGHSFTDSDDLHPLKLEIYSILDASLGCSGEEN